MLEEEQDVWERRRENKGAKYKKYEQRQKQEKEDGIREIN